MLWVCVCVYVCVLMHAQSCLTLCDPMDCSPPSSSVHEILQASILAWVASSSSGGSSWPRDQTHFSSISCTASGFLTTSTKLGLGLKSVDPAKASPVAKTRARWSCTYMWEWKARNPVMLPFSAGASDIWGSGHAGPSEISLSPIEPRPHRPFLPPCGSDSHFNPEPMYGRAVPRESWRNPHAKRGGHSALTLLCQQRSVWSRLWIFQWSCMHVRAGL